MSTAERLKYSNVRIIEAEIKKQSKSSLIKQVFYSAIFSIRIFWLKSVILEGV